LSRRFLQQSHFSATEWTGFNARERERERERETDRQTDRQTDRDIIVDNILAVSGGYNPVGTNNNASTIMVVPVQ